MESNSTTQDFPLCPYCGTLFTSSDPIYEHTEYVGHSQKVCCRCTHCDSVVKVSMKLYIEMESTSKTDATEGDWG